MLLSRCSLTPKSQQTSLPTSRTNPLPCFESFIFEINRIFQLQAARSELQWFDPERISHILSSAILLRRYFLHESILYPSSYTIHSITYINLNVIWHGKASLLPSTYSIYFIILKHLMFSKCYLLMNLLSTLIMSGYIL